MADLQSVPRAPLTHRVSEPCRFLDVGPCDVQMRDIAHLEVEALQQHTDGRSVGRTVARAAFISVDQAWSTTDAIGTMGGAQGGMHLEYVAGGYL